MDMKENRQLRQDISPVGAWAFAIGTSIGWGSLVVTSSTYLSQAGIMGSVLGLLLGAAAMLIISRNYAYMMQCYPEAGGVYTFAKEQFGYDHGFLTAWFLAMTYLAILWANATSLPLFARYFWGDIFRFGGLYTLFGYEVYLGEALLSLAAIALTTVFLMTRKRAAARLMVILAVVFVLGITVVFIGAFLRLDVSMNPAYVPESSVISQIVRIAVISPWAFIGFENISHLSEEFSFKHSRFFRILTVTVVSTTALYILITLLSVSAYPPEYGSWLEYIRDIGNLDGLKALPAFYAAQHYMGHFGVGILMVALLALIVTSLIGNTTALSRLFYALGKDQILPARFSALNRHGAPGKAILLVACLSLPIPFLGRTAIGWIVDVTTIGATIIYALVSASARKLAKARNDRAELWTGGIGLVLMVFYLLYLLLPNLVSEGSMARESYFLFIIWTVLGFLYFRSILQRDHAQRFGKSLIVWVVLLGLVLFIALIWMRQSMMEANHHMMENIRQHYLASMDGSAVRLADERFIAGQIGELEKSDTRTILMATGMFVFALMIMLSNYSFMNKQNLEIKTIANSDAMTGVKNKNAFLHSENEINLAIQRHEAGAFAVVVCDVNGLKYINDNFGHKAGDDYIRAACKMICDLFDHSPVFRTGGDEFVVLLRDRNYQNRALIMDQLRRASEDNIGTNNAVVASGIAEFNPESDESFHEVFEKADKRMYENKQALKSKGARAR